MKTAIDEIGAHKSVDISKGNAEESSDYFFSFIHSTLISHMLFTTLFKNVFFIVISYGIFYQSECA